jgi:hypothetical protein
MKMKTIAVCALMMAALYGCGNNTPNNPSPDMANNPSPDMAGPPAAPTIGAQIDRMGRPGINTALTDPFWNEGVQTVDQHHAKQDAYNQASAPAQWATTMLGGKAVLDIFKANLAVYDGADTGLATMPNVCGNQAAFNGPLGSGYVTLATVLADDELYVDTTQTTCTQYLGAELKALGVNLNDCGGRTLTENVIDVTYNALVIGAVTGPVTNGVTSDGDGAPSNSTFPFLGSAN